MAGHDRQAPSVNCRLASIETWRLKRPLAAAGADYGRQLQKYQQKRWKKQRKKNKVFT